jgi:hypothetical protein
MPICPFVSKVSSPECNGSGQNQISQTAACGKSRLQSRDRLYANGVSEGCAEMEMELELSPRSMSDCTKVLQKQSEAEGRWYLSASRIGVKQVADVFGGSDG